MGKLEIFSEMIFGFVSGHGFSRADRIAKSRPALAAAGKAAKAVAYHFRSLARLKPYPDTNRLFVQSRTAATMLGVLFAFVTSRASAQPIQLRDITAQAGIHFVHNNGAFGKKYLPETMGSGVAFIDYDNDGWPDILLVNSEDWPGHSHAESTVKLYHNNHDGTFTDVTRKAGLAVSLYGMGVAIGDYDNDGYDDIFISALGQSHLFHNNGNGTFTDVTKAAGSVGAERILHQRRVGRLRSRRQTGSGGCELCAVVDPRRSVLHPRRRAQILLHAGVVQRFVGPIVAQPGQRKVRGRDAKGQVLRSDFEKPRSGDCRL